MGLPFELIEYLSEDEIRAAVNEVRRTNLKSADFDWLKTALMKMSKGLVLEAPIYHAGLTLYRARKFTMRPRLTSDLGYPPASSVKDFGRANPPDQSIFYLNTMRNAVFFELRPKPGDFLTLGHWKTVEKLMMFPVGYSDGVFDTMRSNRTRPMFGTRTDARLNHPLNTLLEDFFAEEFTKEVEKNEPWQFKISSAIAENRLSLQDVDGVMYPTVAMRANSDNFALRPASAGKLELIKAEFARVDKIEDFSFKITVLDTATEFPDGAIAWKGKPKWTLQPSELMKFAVEDGRLQAYDAGGRIREYD